MPVAALVQLEIAPASDSQWECGRCSLLNREADSICAVCQAARGFKDGFAEARAGVIEYEPDEVEEHEENELLASMFNFQKPEEDCEDDRKGGRKGKGKGKGRRGKDFDEDDGDRQFGERKGSRKGGKGKGKGKGKRR